MGGWGGPRPTPRPWHPRALPRGPPASPRPLPPGRPATPTTPAEETPVAWTWKNRHGGRAFYTSLGHPEDFALDAMQRLTVNAIHWALGRKVPTKWAGRMPIDVPYRGMVSTAGGNK